MIINVSETVEIINLYLRFKAKIKTSLDKGKITIYKKKRAAEPGHEYRKVRLVKKKEITGTKEELKYYLLGMMEMVGYKEDGIPEVSNAIVELSRMFERKDAIIYKIVDLINLIMEEEGKAATIRILAEVLPDRSDHSIYNYIAYSRAVRHLKSIGVRDEFLRKYPITLWRIIYGKINKENLNEVLLIVKKKGWKCIKILKRRMNNGI